MRRLGDPSFARSRALRDAFHARIPGGGHTYAKGDDQFPDGLAPIMLRGHGCRAIDVDGNEFIEFGIGLRAVTLGHGRPEVVEAARRAAADGLNFTRPSLAELEAADEVAALLPGADMVKFSKDGSNATSAAVRLARAATGRDVIAVCADQPFFSVDDWFIGSTPVAAGIPSAVRRLTLRFPYNDLAALETMFTEHPSKIAAVIMEPASWIEPAAGYLQGVKELCHRHGALLILDETITGFRWHRRGAQHCYGVTADLAVFGKAMGNGYPISALVGRRDLMSLGGLDHDRDRVFLLSYTHGAEHASLAAMRAVLRIYEEEGITDILTAQGDRLRRGIEQRASALGIADRFRIVGRSCNLVYQTLDPDGASSQAYRTLFLQELVRRGVIAPSFVVSAAHDDEAIDQAVEAVGEALVVYKAALEDGVDRYLEGRPVQPVMRTLNFPREE